jgi:hypothetical protein
MTLSKIILAIRMREKVYSLVFEGSEEGTNPLAA